MIEDDLISQINDCLEVELPTCHKDKQKKFNSYVERDLMRASYEVLDNLSKMENWKPSKKLARLIEAYQVIF